MEAPVPGACVFCDDHGATVHLCEKAPRLTVRNLVDEADAVAKAAGLAATVNVVHRLLKRGPTRRSVRVLALQISRDRRASGMDVDFFVKEEERARSESSQSSLLELVTPLPSSNY
jgi:hypothetical protein